MVMMTLAVIVNILFLQCHAWPTAKPTPVPTAKPTAKPTEEPTPSPTPSPTASPTGEPTVLQQCYPRGPCNSGYMDETNGKSNYWSCAAGCVGGKWISDGGCGCACVPIAACGIPSLSGLDIISARGYVGDVDGRPKKGKKGPIADKGPKAGKEPPKDGQGPKGKKKKPKKGRNGKKKSDKEEGSDTEKLVFVDDLVQNVADFADDVNEPKNGKNLGNEPDGDDDFDGDEPDEDNVPNHDGYYRIDLDSFGGRALIGAFIVWLIVVPIGTVWFAMRHCKGQKANKYAKVNFVSESEADIAMNSDENQPMIDVNVN